MVAVRRVGEYDSLFDFPLDGDPLPLLVYSLDRSGAPDPTFLQGGRLRIPRGSQAALGPDGSIFVAGRIGSGPAQDVFVRRYRPTGALDRTFGKRGTLRIRERDSQFAVEIVAQPRGSVEVITDTGCPTLDCLTYPKLFRYSAAGRLLRTTVIRAEDGVNSIAPRPDGSLVVLGNTLLGEVLVAIRFDPEGRRTSSTQLPDDASLLGTSGLTLQPDGRAIFDTYGFVQRLNSGDATVDPAFGEPNNGCTARRISAEGQLSADASGRIYAAGQCGVVRLDPNGYRDATFGVEGVAAVGESGASLIALGPDGRPVVAFPPSKPFQIAVERLTTTGGLDAGFGSGGTTLLDTVGRIPANDSLAALARARGGRIIAVGTNQCRDGSCNTLAVTRYLRNGRVDRAFGRAGRTLIPIDELGRESIGELTPTAVVVNRRGFVYIGAIVNFAGIHSNYAYSLTRLRPSGALDSSFGDGGFSVVPPSSGAGFFGQITIDRRGRLLAAGSSSGCGGGCIKVARFLPSGKLDPGFADDGVFQYDVPNTRGDSALAVRLQADGRIIVVGGARAILTALRLLPNGILDRTFAKNGAANLKLRIYFDHLVHNPQRTGSSVALDGRGRIVLGVEGGVGDAGELVRLRPNGKLDRSFQRKGRLLLPNLSISSVRAGGCGVIATGTWFDTYTGTRSMTVLGVPSNRRAKLRAFTPFGRRGVSDASGLVPAGRGSVIVGGTVSRYAYSGDFALAKYRERSLLPRCGR